MIFDLSPYLSIEAFVWLWIAGLVALACVLNWKGAGND